MEKKKENLAGDAKGKLLVGLEAGGKGSIGEAGAFAGGAREPTGSSSWGKGSDGDMQNGSSKSEGVVCRIVAGNDDHEGAQWVGSKEQLNGGECAKEPRQRGDRRVGEAGCGKGEIDAVDGRQMEVMWESRRSRVRKVGGEASLLMHGPAEGGGSVQARPELGTESSGAGDEGGDGGRQNGSSESEGGGSRDHDNGDNTRQGVQIGQRDGDRRKARVDR